MLTSYAARVLAAEREKDPVRKLEAERIRNETFYQLVQHVWRLEANLHGRIEQWMEERLEEDLESYSGRPDILAQEAITEFNLKDDWVYDLAVKVLGFMMKYLKEDRHV